MLYIISHELLKFHDALYLTHISFAPHTKFNQNTKHTIKL